MANLLTRIFQGVDEARHASLPGYGHRYFEQILAEYYVSGLAAADPPGYVTEIIARHDAQQAGQPGQVSQELTWADLYLLEKYILRKQPLEMLRRRTWSLRGKYREIVGQKAYDAYLLSKPPDETQADVDADVLRGDLERLLDGLHWNYTLVPLREQMRTNVLKYISKRLAWVFAITLVLLYFSANPGCLGQIGTDPSGNTSSAVTQPDSRAGSGQDLFATLLLVSFAGAVGGFVSLQRRIQTIPTEGDPLVSIFELTNGQFALLLAPVSGAIFALLLYMVFVAGLLEGSIFPNIDEFASLSLGRFSWPAIRLNSRDFALLMVWSFIAGFAEQFVPDTLTRLVAKGREVSTSSTNTQVPSGAGGLGGSSNKTLSSSSSRVSPSSSSSAPSGSPSSTPSSISSSGSS